MVNAVLVNADDGRVSRQSHDTVTKFHQGFAFPFLLHLMFDQTLSNLIVCLIISQKLHAKVA